MADNSEESLELQEWQSKTQQSEENSTGLLDDLKANLETMSGMSLDHVKVHYNSSKSAKLGAYAYVKISLDLRIAMKKHKKISKNAVQAFLEIFFI